MVPRPIKPISIISTPLCPFLLLWSGIGRQRGVPTEALDRRRPRLVFAPDPAAITNSVEMAEQEGIVDLARARLIAAGIIGELDMRDAIAKLLDPVGQDGDAALAGSPVAGGKIMQHLRQPVLVQLLAQLGLVEIIRE